MWYCHQFVVHSFQQDRVASNGISLLLQVVGRLAEKRLATEQALQGLLVRHGAEDSLMHPSDLPYFTKLHPGCVLQRQLLALQKPFSEVRKLLSANQYNCEQHPGFKAAF